MKQAQVQSPVSIGQVLANKYRVEKVLGVGGMGVVVAARHQELGQLVALKFLLTSALENPSIVERFLREGRNAVRLRGEHVCRVTDVGKLESGAPYIVMEYLEGADLADELKRRGPLPIAEIATFLLQACEALAEAHALGIVHRDLKPHNLYRTDGPDGVPMVKVLDFGISTGAAGDAADYTITRSQTTLGSPAYMSPEQTRSAKNVDGRSDVWSLGVVLYQLLTGRLPFDAAALPDLYVAIVSRAPLLPRELRHDTPPALEDVIIKCLQKQREDRFSDVGALAAALAPFAPLEARGSVDVVKRLLARAIVPLQASEPALDVTAPGKPRAGAAAQVAATAAPVLDFAALAATSAPVELEVIPPAQKVSTTLGASAGELARRGADTRAGKKGAALPARRWWLAAVTAVALGGSGALVASRFGGGGPSPAPAAQPVVGPSLVDHTPDAGAPVVTAPLVPDAAAAPAPTPAPAIEVGVGAGVLPGVSSKPGKPRKPGKPGAGAPAPSTATPPAPVPPRPDERKDHEKDKDKDLFDTAQ